MYDYARGGDKMSNLLTTKEVMEYFNVKDSRTISKFIRQLQDNFDTFNLIKMRLSHLLGVMQIITLYKENKLSFLKNE